jgi:hypothetical protein
MSYAFASVAKILELDELGEAPGVAPFFCTLDNLLTLEENRGIDGYDETGILGVSGSECC